MIDTIFTIKSNKNELVHICKIQENDAWGICDFVVSNEKRLQTFFPGTRAQNLTPDLAKIFTELKSKEFENKIEYLFTLKEQSSKRVVGLIYIKELDKVEGQGEFAYAIDYNCEGHGIISKAVSELSTYAFENLNLNRLQIIVHKSNFGSIKVANNCNFTWQKTLLKEFTPTGKEAMDMELYELYKD